MKIVFLGSGPVAAESLRLLKDAFDIEAVITKPSTAGQMASVIESRQYQVDSKQELDELFGKEKFESKVAVLIDFGIIVSRKIIDSFPFGIINSHFSLLPEWRGADPITYSILSGQKQTGVSLMLLTEKMDEGLLLSQTAVGIFETDTTATLTDKLIKESNRALKIILPLWLSKQTLAVPQHEYETSGLRATTYSRKLVKSDGIIDWHKPASVIEREIRAFQPWPRNRTSFSGLDVIVTRAEVDDSPLPLEIGKLKINEDKTISVKCGNGALKILELQPAGKKPMPTSAFLAGYGNKIN